VHLFTDISGYGLGKVEFENVPDMPPIKPGLSSLVPDPTTIKTFLVVAGQRAEFQVVSVQTDSPYRTRIHMRAVLAGYVSDLWFDVWSWQDVVDVRGHIVWSDRSSPYHVAQDMAEDVKILSTVGSYTIYYGHHWGIVDGNVITPLSDGNYPDAMSFPFTGIWEPPLPDDMLPPEDDPLSGLWDTRMDVLEAAREGPVCAMSSRLNGQLYATKSFIPMADSAPGADEEFQRFLGKLETPGEIHDQREFASPKRTGSTGDQPPFCFVQDYVLAVYANPMRIWQLEESTVDYLLRCHHHREADGKPIKEADHKGWRTWNLCTHRTGSDLLGKGSETPGGSHAFGRAMVDDQHAGSDYIDVVRHVTDNPLLEMDLYDRIQGDLARAKRGSRSHITGPADAPRAGGRLLKRWAKGWWTTHSDDLRDAIKTLSVEEFALWEEFVATPEGPIARSSIEGPVQPASIIPPDARVIANGPSFMPWQEAVLCIGLLHQFALWDNEGNDSDLALRCLRLFLTISETCIRFGTVRADDGLLYPVNGVLWLPNGEANPPSYYRFPRPGAGYNEAGDMLVGTLGWFGALGWPTMLAGYIEYGKPGYVMDLAEEIRNANLLPPRNAKVAQYLAI
jgi:hypothetical protein